MNHCLICKKAAQYGDLCKDCWLGLKLFQHSPKLLGRANSYLNHKNKLRTKKERRGVRKRDSELSRLIRQQKADARDTRVRFEHAISK